MKTGWCKGFGLLPFSWVVDRFGINIEFSVKPFDQLLYSFNLAISWATGAAVGYNADADSAAAAIPGSAWCD